MSGYAKLTHDFLRGVSKIPARSIPIVRATAENINGYGKLLSSPSEIKYLNSEWVTKSYRKVINNEAPPTVGLFHHFRKNDGWYETNAAVGGDYKTGLYDDGHIYLRELNYHPCGPQIVYPMPPLTDYIIVLAPPGDGIQITDIKAFHIPDNCGLQINAGVWHQPSFPIFGDMWMYNIQSSVHACVLYDSVDEDGVLMKVNIKNIEHKKNTRVKQHPCQKPNKTSYTI